MEWEKEGDQINRQELCEFPIYTYFFHMRAIAKHLPDEDNLAQLSHPV